MIIACVIGIDVTVVPELFAKFPSGLKIFMSNGIVAGSVTAIVSNIFFNMLPSRKRNSKQLAE